MLSSAACLPACLSDQWSKRTVVRPGLRLSCCSSLRGFLRSQGPESCKNVVPEKGGSRGPRVQELSKSQAGCVSLGPSSCSLAAWPEARRQTQREREEEKGETQLGSPRRQTGSQPQTELAFLESRTPIASFCLLPFAFCPLPLPPFYPCHYPDPQSVERAGTWQAKGPHSLLALVGTTLGILAVRQSRDLLYC